MASSTALAPTPVKVINAAVLSCLDDMFYRLPFPNLVELERLIKDAHGDSAMHEFRTGLRTELDTPRALEDFERGWDRYWKETQSQRPRAAEGAGQTQSFQDRKKNSNTRARIVG